MTASVERARQAFARRAWAEACEVFVAAADEGMLEAGDHEALAVAAYLVGRDDRCDEAWEAAYRGALDDGDPGEAARCAVLLALCLVLRGQMAQAGGWLARASGHLAEGGAGGAAAGYVLIPQLLAALDNGEAATAVDLAVRATEIGARVGDRDLCALGVLGHGQALITLGDQPAGLARLDEVMVAVTSDEVGPIVSGIVYCAVIIQCLQLFDLARASEWTAALGSWCDAQPDLVPYRGQCLVHRSQLHQAAGRWQDARTTAEAASRHLAHPPHPALGFAHYQEAELHRLVGAFEEADTVYRLASRHGYDPMPGVALLELARGDVGAAASGIRRALGEPRAPLDRPPLLVAAVDVLRAAGDLEGARAAADELRAIASSSSSPLLAAMAAHASGTVAVAEGDPVGGLAELRLAARSWQSLQLPYEAGRTAVMLGVACAALGDRTAAGLEFDNARTLFTELGARPDLDRLGSLTGEPPDTRLSAREREVLAHLAAGKTNREIAAALVISQHTAARHVEHIFTKLGVSSRAAATAYAYEHGLLTQRR